MHNGAMSWHVPLHGPGKRQLHMGKRGTHVPDGDVQIRTVVHVERLGCCEQIRQAATMPGGLQGKILFPVAGWRPLATTICLPLPMAVGTDLASPKALLREALHVWCLGAAPAEATLSHVHERLGGVRGAGLRAGRDGGTGGSGACGPSGARRARCRRSGPCPHRAQGRGCQRRRCWRQV